MILIIKKYDFVSECGFLTLALNVKLNSEYQYKD
jgi:hypothetical protein